MTGVMVMVMMTDDRRLGTLDYPQAITEWLDSGSNYLHLHGNPSRLCSFGSPDLGMLTVEATILYSFVLGLSASDGSFDLDGCESSSDECIDQALAAFRYCLCTHESTADDSPDGLAWGNSGMSPKLADQMALATEVLDGFLEDTDREQFARLIECEADSNILLPYHLDHVDHGFYRKRPPVPTERFGASYPESNAWRANVLGRALLADPDHANADQWREAMLMHLTNALSTPADADDDTFVDGRPISEWHAGANLHPNFALEHHGFFHPGYVNRALLSLFSAALAFESAGVEPPEALLRNVPEVWDVQRRLILWDGSLAYPAGDDYPRYCWGLLYLLPALVFAQHRLDDPLARRAELKLANLLRREQLAGGDGSFSASRLAAWREAIEDPAMTPPGRPAPSVFYRSQVDAPYYLALAHWWHQAGQPAEPISGEQFDHQLQEPFIEPDCGLVFQRGPERFASWSWNAYRSGAQGLVIPRDGDHLAEWEGNLVSRFVVRGCSSDRRVVAHEETVFPNGFATCGTISACEGAIEHKLGLVALPDGQTTVYLSRARTMRQLEMLLHEGTCLNIANDLFNDNSRSIYAEGSEMQVQGFGAAREELAIESLWVNIDDMLGVVAMDTQDRFTLLVDGERRATGMSLCYHELLHPCANRSRQLFNNAIVEDTALALVTGIDAEETAAWSAWHLGPALSNGDLRALTIRGSDDVRYLVAKGFTGDGAELHLPLTMRAAGSEILMGQPEQFRLIGDGVVLTLPPGEMLVVAMAVNSG